MGKSTVKEMAEQLRKLAKEPIPTWTQDWDAYGGILQSNDDSTGRFRLSTDDQGRHWLLNPSGHHFFIPSLAQVVDSNPAAIVPETKSCFHTIPGSGFEDCRSEDAKWSLPMISFERSNLRRAFGDHWRESWLQITANRIRSWRFNTLGPNSDSGLIRDGLFPHILELVPPQTSTLLYRDFPDVFDEQFVEKSYEIAKKLLAYRNSPYLIGYQLSAPAWALDNVELSSEMLECIPGSNSRRRFREWIQQRYQQNESYWIQTWHHNAQQAQDMCLPSCY